MDLEKSMSAPRTRGRIEGSSWPPATTSNAVSPRTRGRIEGSAAPRSAAPAVSHPVRGAEQGDIQAIFLLDQATAGRGHSLIAATGWLLMAVGQDSSIRFIIFMAVSA